MLTPFGSPVDCTFQHLRLSLTSSATSNRNYSLSPTAGIQPHQKDVDGLDSNNCAEWYQLSPERGLICMQTHSELGFHFCHDHDDGDGDDNRDRSIRAFECFPRVIDCIVRYILLVAIIVNGIDSRSKWYSCGATKVEYNSVEMEWTTIAW